MRGRDHAEALKHLRQFERADLRVLLRVIDGAAAALKLDAHGDWIIRRLRQPQLYHWAAYADPALLRRLRRLCS